MVDASYPAIEGGARRGRGAGRAVRPEARRRHRALFPGGRRVWLWYIGAIAAYGAVFGLWQLGPEPLPLTVHAAAVMLAAISVFPIALWYADGKRGLPMFEMICLSYGVQYSLPVYLQSNQSAAYGSARLEIPWPAMLGALLLASLGVGSMIATYVAITRSRRVGRRIPNLDLPLSGTRWSQYLAFAFLAGTGTTAASALHLAPSASGSMGFIIRFLTFQSTVGLTLLAGKVYARRGSELRWHFALYGWLGVTVGVGLTTGMLEDALVPIGVVLLTRWHVTGRAPWRAALLGVLLFFMLQPIKQEYRTQAWDVPHPPSVVERVTLWFSDGLDMVGTISRGDVGDNARAVVVTASNRLDLLHALALVHTLTPSEVPYLHGRTYTYLAYSWVPRLLWPDKPQTQDATDELATRYGLLVPQQQGVTSVGIGHLAEAYANFGTLGIVFVMAAQGALYALLNVMLNRPQSDGGRAVYVAQMIWFLNGIGTSSAIILGSLIQSMAPTLALLSAFGTGRRGPAARSGRGRAPDRARRPASVHVDHSSPGMDGSGRRREKL